MKQIQIKIHPFLNNAGVENLAKELLKIILSHCEDQDIRLYRKPKVVLRL